MAIELDSVDVTAVANYPALNAPSMTFTLEPQVMHIQNAADATAGVLLSFDGVTDHAYVGIGQAAYIRLEQKATNIWAKRAAAGATIVYVTVEGGAPQDPGFI